ncbi:DUF3800 domain-containing protein [Streptomyces sp. NPDC002911]
MSLTLRSRSWQHRRQQTKHRAYGCADPVAVPSGAATDVFQVSVHLCYIDEAGNGQTLDPAKPDAPPVLVIGGFTVPCSQVRDLTWDFLNVKKHYRPQLQHVMHLSELIQHEIKGSDVRKNLRAGNHNWHRAAMELISSLLDILERHDARLLARVWIKEEGLAFNESGVYPASVGSLTETFQAQLAHEHSRGMMVLDSRTKVKNAPNVHCVTTRKYRTGGDGLRGDHRVPRLRAQRHAHLVAGCGSGGVVPAVPDRLSRLPERPHVERAL